MLRSNHPTHSVAAKGALAALVVGRHGEDRSPVGAQSAFTKVRAALPPALLPPTRRAHPAPASGRTWHSLRCPASGVNRPPTALCPSRRQVRDLYGQVAFVGCPHGARCNTTMHGVEESLDTPPAYVPPRPQQRRTHRLHPRANVPLPHSHTPARYSHLESCQRDCDAVWICHTDSIPHAASYRG
eukprot:SAG11_NODE_1227_length_5474_cov_5.294326_1_plen_184_part_10